MHNGIVIVDRHEPHGEVAQRLLELAEEKGYDARTVEAQRGEHDAELSFRVPGEVAEAFDKDRAKRWPDRTSEDAERPGPAPLNGDAYEADGNRAAAETAATNAAEAKDGQRTTRPGKATANQEKPKE